MGRNLVSFRGSNERVDDASASRLYSIVGECLGEILNPEVDTVQISRPTINSRSAASHLLILTINEKRILAFKRCYDFPDFLRREVAVAEARHLMGFPDYCVNRAYGLDLRSDGSNEICAMIRGWQERDYLIIDFDTAEDRISLSNLQVSLIQDIEAFVFQLGQWAAFNYVLVVRDRHPGNFLYEKSSGLVISIDNEEGPFDSLERFLSPIDIIMQMKSIINRFLALGDRNRLVSTFKSGFEAGWRSVVAKLDELTCLTPQEIASARTLLEQDMLSVSRQFIDRES